jgi:hypothetical protein
VVYVLAALWGVADAIWQTQINALYGVLFAKNEEAAFSNYRLWESLGFLFAFLTQVSQFCSLCGTKISKRRPRFFPVVGEMDPSGTISLLATLG